MEWDDKKVMKLIDLYRSKQLLWDPKHSDYKRRPKRHDAFNDIANELFTSVTEVERKIKNVTSHYYREKKKVDSSNKSGAADEIYQSKWFAYKSLNFLSSKNMRSSGTIDTDKLEGHNSQQDSLDLQILTENTTPTPNKRPKNNQKDEMVSEALTIMRYVSERQNAFKEKDEDALFGDYIASQLRKMDRSTKAVVRHRINNIIFEAESGCRADMFSDFSRPSSAHSQPGYSAGTPPTNTTSVYYVEPNANPQTGPPLEALDREDAALNPCNSSSQAQNSEYPDLVTRVKIEEVETDQG